MNCIESYCDQLANAISKGTESKGNVIFVCETWLSVPAPKREESIYVLDYTWQIVEFHNNNKRKDVVGEQGRKRERGWKEGERE